MLNALPNITGAAIAVAAMNNLFGRTRALTTRLGISAVPRPLRHRSVAQLTLPALLAARPRKHAVEFSKPVGVLVPLLAFRLLKREPFFVKPKQSQSLVPRPQMQRIFEERSIPRQILKP